MSTPATREKVIDYLRRSGLVDEERLKRVLAENVGAETDPRKVLDGFEAAGVITDWHKERLLEGKWKGFVLGKYRILSPLGSGAMGSVFLAEHKVMRHRVALKVLARRLVSKPSNVVRFEREARAAAAINHPNVVRAFDIDHEGDVHYLVMEYVQGDNLQKHVRKVGPLDPEKAADYARQVARGLHEAHRCGLVHRDIKPSNLLLETAGTVKILDLGLARLQEEVDAAQDKPHESKLIGTVDYLAPEQAKNSRALDGRADIYSLGCTLYYLLTGSPPFPTGTLAERVMKHHKRRPLEATKRRYAVLKERGEMSQARLNLPDGLLEICNRMMEKSPDKRFQTAGAAADALTELLEGRYQLQGSALTIMEADDGLGSSTGESSVSRAGVSRGDERSTAGRSQDLPTSVAERSSILDDYASTFDEPPARANDSSGDRSNVLPSRLLPGRSAAAAAKSGAKTTASKTPLATADESLPAPGQTGLISIHADPGSSESGRIVIDGSQEPGDTMTGRSSTTSAHPISRPATPETKPETTPAKKPAKVSPTPKPTVAPVAGPQAAPEVRPYRKPNDVNYQLWALVIGASLLSIALVVITKMLVNYNR